MSNHTATTADVTFDVTSAESTIAAYEAADRGGKARIRATLNRDLLDAMKSGDSTTAFAIVEVVKQLDAHAAKPSTPEVDYVARIADLRASLMAAVHAIDDGQVIMPSGVSCPEYVPSEIAGGTPDEALVKRLVTVTGRKAGRGNVADWVASVVTDEPATIATLRARWTATDDYPKAAPSAGAIAAMLDRGGDDRFEEVELNGRRAIRAL